VSVHEIQLGSDGNLGLMFGPLNGVRVVLVAGAVLAAIAAILIGYVVAGLVLLVGVAVHGLGWLYLYKQQTQASVD
jgi:hypothetical protein